MAYTPREIKDRVAVGDDIFLVEDLGNNKIKLTPAPTHVSEAGTPVNKALLQPIEDELGRLSSTKVDKANAVTSVAGRIGAVTLSKSDVGLGSVQNYGIATQAQAQEGTANDVYMTPLRVKESINHAIVTGTYTGTGTEYREINIGFQPKTVFVSNQTKSTDGGLVFIGANRAYYMDRQETGTTRDLKTTANGFLVGQDFTGKWGNRSTNSYFWMAFA